MFTRGLSLPILEAWIRNKFVLVTSDELLDELGEVSLRPKFKRRITKPDAEKLLELLYLKADVVKIASPLNLGRDIEDYIVLGTAVNGQASYIVTADKDLLDDQSLKTTMQKQGIQILSAGEFIQVLKEKK